MRGITGEALEWSLDQLGSWTSATPPGKRVKQVIYRLLLLRELKVDSAHEEHISTADFRRHCRRFLLVADESLAYQTGAIQRYFVPTTCEFQRASGSGEESTDWAIGTMWTRCQTWQVNEILEMEAAPGTQGSRLLRFKTDYVEILKDQLGGTSLPALPLAIFLLRDPNTSGVNLNTCKTADDLLNTFRKTFNLNDPDVLKLFNFDTSGFSETLFEKSTLSSEFILGTVLSKFPFEHMLAEESLGSLDPKVKYVIAEEDRKGVSDKPVQVLVHGCPGSGKSYLLKQWTSGVSKSLTVVFHPETSYADFVGVYRPYPLYRAEHQEFVDEAGRERKHGEPYVTYEFVPGPLIDAYCFAKRNPMESIALIIEELSRSNASLVFGDMLQLLDRVTEPEEGLDIGASSYSINPKPEVAAYLTRHGISTESGGRMRFPRNLHIWATMNRSDQNARQLDSAFLRRWKKQYLSYITQCDYGETAVEVPGGTISWDSLRARINERLVGLAPEDKFVGPYFLSHSSLAERDTVAEDLLGYLWNDVLKARARDFFALDTFAEVRAAWVDQTGNPFKEVDLP